jgi:peptide/nickel transport system permease protein
MLPNDATPEQIERMTERLGLDRPYHEQFLAYLAGVARGDLGDSIRYGQPVTTMFFNRLPNSLGLMGVSLVFALVLAIPLGVVSATRRGSGLDTLCKVIGTLGIATPNFWLGIVLMFVFSVRLGVLPVAGMGTPLHFVLPAFAMGAHLMAGFMRLLRSSMLEVLDSEYTKFARIKGVSESRVIWQHCLKNSITALLSFAGVYIAVMFGGMIVVETIFAWPGVGRMLYTGIMDRDYPVIQGALILKGSWIVGINLLVDLLYAYIDPRIRYS